MRLRHYVNQGSLSVPVHLGPGHPDDDTRMAMTALLIDGLNLVRRIYAAVPGAEDTSAQDIQTEVYEVGKAHGFENLREWFKACYEVLLGQEQGPRMGSFIALYGINESAELIAKALSGADLSA